MGKVMEIQANSEAGRQKIFLFVLLGLFILRIPFLAGMDLFDIQWKWTEPIFEIGTFALTLFLIWGEMDCLADYNMDTLVLFIIIFFAPLHTLILNYWGLDHPLAFPSIPSLIIWLITIVFAMEMWRKRSKLPGMKSSSLAWFFIGTLAGLAITVMLSYPFSFQISAEELSNGLSIKETIANIPLSFVYQIGYAAVFEEPLFRGFLWGYLRKLNWKDVWIWLIQAGLFTLGHIYYINSYPISFWVIIPAFSLMLGLLVWRSRSIASSMAAHGMMNAAGYAFAYILALFRFG
jgi:membrane protease YdiL (CAAX protease family)